MRTIRVGIGATRPDAGDVLDYAIALIEEYGWNKVGEGDWQESSKTVGYTLHDAIGAACTGLSAASGAGATKDWQVTTTSGRYANLRVEATELVQKHLPEGSNDKTFNDQAGDVGEVLDVLRAARADHGTEVQV